jgi:tRNA1(Val) A37 N6-methylase TrmN6
MSNGTINVYKSFTYQQPVDYRFSHDSVFLARKVFETVNTEKLETFAVLDLCAGCGIVGLDYAFHTVNEGPSRIGQLDFFEVQDVYKDFLISNIATFKDLTRCQISSQTFIDNYANAETFPELKEKYNLIVCNPPYFRVSQGKLSPSEFKNRCRFFIDSGFPELIKAISYFLKPGGTAFVLVQSLHDHNIDAASEFIKFPELSAVHSGKIRSTDLYRLTKNSKV